MQRNDIICDSIDITYDIIGITSQPSYLTEDAKIARKQGLFIPSNRGALGTRRHLCFAE